MEEKKIGKVEQWFGYFMIALMFAIYIYAAVYTFFADDHYSGPRGSMYTVDQYESYYNVE